VKRVNNIGLARHFLYYPFKHLFFIDEETGKKLYEYWIKNIKNAEKV